MGNESVNSGVITDILNRCHSYGYSYVLQQIGEVNA